jgi:hypothetical protein
MRNVCHPGIVASASAERVQDINTSCRRDQPVAEIVPNTQPAFANREIPQQIDCS